MIGQHNMVPGTDWHYGLFVTGDETVTFDVYGPDNQRIEGLTASRYRTTELAERMGDSRPGYEDAARAALEAYSGDST